MKIKLLWLALGLHYITMGQSLCYQMDMTSSIRVTQSLNTSTLDILDKVLFAEKQLTTQHLISINSNNELTCETHTVSHQNMFPQWYHPPGKTVTDHTGTKSYITTDNPLLLDGWAGAYPNQTSGTYVEDKTKNERYYSIQHSELSALAHDTLTKDLIEHGITYHMEWQLPDNEMIDHLDSLGYTWSSQSDIITATTKAHVLTWYVSDYIFTSEELALSDSTVLKKSYAQYAYDTTFSKYLLHYTSTISAEHFTNGDCYEAVEAVTYTDYSDCTSTPTAPRSPAVAHLAQIFPNPASDMITVQLPDLEAPTRIIINNMEGKQMLYRKIAPHTQEVKLNISPFPAGVYIVSIQSNHQTESIQLIKQ